MTGLVGSFRSVSWFMVLGTAIWCLGLSALLAGCGSGGNETAGGRGRGAAPMSSLE